MFRLALLAVLALAVAADAAPKEVSSVITKCPFIYYNIPPQPLSSALETFASASGLQIIYEKPPRTFQGLAGVVGCMDRTTALSVLLKNSGMIIRFYNAQDVVLGLADNEGVAEIESGRPLPSNITLLPVRELDVRGQRGAVRGFNWLYAKMVENKIRKALLQDPSTNNANYLVGIQLWMTSYGNLGRFRLVSSSGDGHRDEAISSVVRSVTVQLPPPSDLAQPITVWIRSRSEG